MKNETTKTPLEAGDEICIVGERGGVETAPTIWIVRDVFSDGLALIRKKDGKRARAYGNVEGFLRIYSYSGHRMTTLLSWATIERI